jgi:hypothetical protein
MLLCALVTVPACDEGGEEDDGGPCWSDDPAYGPKESGDSLMTTWGAACETHEDCVALIGDPDAICESMAVVYDLPGGFCTKPCRVEVENPDDPEQAAQTFEDDDPECAVDGGVDCVGVNDIFSRCIPRCTSHDQCTRDGYACRRMPEISLADDPTYCLMSDCCEGEDSCS